MTVITVEISPAIIKKHSYSGDNPFRLMISKLEETESSVCTCSETSFVVCCPDDRIDAVYKHVLDIYKFYFPTDQDMKEVTFSVDDAKDLVTERVNWKKYENIEDYNKKSDDIETKTETDDVDSDDADSDKADLDDIIYEESDKSYFKNHNNRIAMAKARNYIRHPGDKAKRERMEREEMFKQRLNYLVGAKELKALIKQIGQVAEQIKATGSYKAFSSRCYLFSINDSSGLTTYLDVFAYAIKLYGLVDANDFSVCETAVGPYKESYEPFLCIDFLRHRYATEVLPTNLVCIDISEWMGKTNNHYFKQFLRKIDETSGAKIVVFRVPFIEKDVLGQIASSISDILSVTTVSFPPFNKDEIREFALNEFAKSEFSLTKKAWDCFQTRIIDEKSDGRYYGIRTIQKVVRDFIYNKCLINAKRGITDRRISYNDAKNLCSDGLGKQLSGMEQLEQLVGNDAVKKRVKEIVAQIEVACRGQAAQRPCIHMRFLGNPGTGKTTVAQIIGKILREKGILRVGGFFEYSGRDFCGRYIGETAPKTLSMCRDAYGSVLFIDEAYSLYRGDGSERDFGREVLETLVTEMENHRHDFVVIMAGYTDEMNTLMQGNSGLASRIPYVIEFPNFSREQLYEIFVTFLGKTFKYEPQFLEFAHEYFMGLPDEMLKAKEFANARFVRNLYERVCGKAAMRCQLSSINELVLTKEDFEQAIADNEFSTKNAKRTKIGFI